MFYAVDKFGYRIRPGYSGQLASCLHCGNEVMAKCGEIYAWHWQHVTGQLCDPWKEHETDWHRNWKANFPVECQEVSIVNEFEKHIADVRTPAGMIIEFQNSSISPHTIRIREQFYRQMVWVINADPFKENLSIRSIVRRKLRELENDIDPYTDRVVEDTENLVKEIDADIKKAKEKVDVLMRKVGYREFDQQKVQGYLQGVNNLCKQVIDEWKVGRDYYNSLLSKAIEQLGQYKPGFQELTTKINELINQQKTTQSHIEYLDGLVGCNLQGAGYKIVSYAILNKDNYNRFFAVQKSSMSDLFPVIEPISDEAAFQRLEFKQKHYCFVFDPDPVYQKCRARSNETAEQLIQTITERQNIEDIMVRQATEFLREQLGEIGDLINSLKQELEDAGKTVADLEQRKQKALEAKVVELAEARFQDEQNKNSEKYNIMRTFKGLYDLSWKHERQSWKKARCRVFFDLQDGFLYERIARWEVRKLSVQDFLVAMITRID